MVWGRVLLVDDNQVNLMVACAMLDHWHVHYKCASDGKEAIDKWQRLKPDLILMDLQMPVCDGYSATKQIRDLESDETRTPIIALSATKENAVIDKCLTAGMDDFICKPFTSEELYEKLTKWLDE